jgi:hypothetical protein
METILALLRTVAVAVIGFFIAVGAFFTGHTGVVLSTPTATTTPTVIAAATTTAQVASSTKPLIPIKKSDTTVAASSTPVIIPSAPAIPTDELNTLARASLVNILCTTQSGGTFNPISGSGVIIDSRGIILTNAHVGQYFLLRDYPTANNIDCVVRTGSPAQSRYTAELMYLPPSWISANASKITADTPTGTGENDYAFLLITGSTNSSVVLPSSFPALPMDGNDPTVGEQMLLAAYPAGFLGGIAITLDLYITSAIATVGQVYTFADPANIDLFSLGGTVVSQSGSSGGAAVSLQGKLKGLIATEIPGATTADRDLRAITIAHINRSLIEAGLGGITPLLSQDVTKFAADFNSKLAPAETQALETALNQ